MKIVIVGDPHGSDKVKKVPLKGADLILCTGDLGKADLAREFYFKNLERAKEGLPKKEPTKSEDKKMGDEIHNSSKFVLKYLSKFAPVYTIGGNVRLDYVKVNKMKNISFVKNTVRTIHGLRIGFLEYFVDTNWVQDFKPSDYSKKLKSAKKETEKAKKILKRFGEVDILICHQPPYGILDKVTNKHAPKAWYGKNAGSKVILDYIKKKQPKYVFCGHIHEGKGKKKIGKSLVENVGLTGDYSILNIK
jgi:Icc-related predicted phosphoesterase|tara:strand:+ start:115 stop:858 length:744 start_codon:yes stop_codon:yes gene_type:complete